MPQTCPMPTEPTAYQFRAERCGVLVQGLDNSLCSSHSKRVVCKGLQLLSEKAQALQFKLVMQCAAHGNVHPELRQDVASLVHIPATRKLRR